MMDKTYKTIAQWQQRLSPEAFYITRGKGTEPPYSGQYNDHYKQGIYHCICCDTPLFKSDTKFDAGCGWPSYFAPINADHVREELDNSNNKTRTEILCNICDAHLGHVFTDGPAPTGLRYCINSAALRFEAL